MFTTINSQTSRPEIVHVTADQLSMNEQQLICLLAQAKNENLQDSPQAHKLIQKFIRKIQRRRFWLDLVNHTSAMAKAEPNLLGKLFIYLHALTAVVSNWPKYF